MKLKWVATAGGVARARLANGGSILITRQSESFFWELDTWVDGRLLHAHGKASSLPAAKKAAREKLRNLER